MSSSTYPVHVDAHLDTHLSRWVWLFKWLLALPHYIVLAFLWLAFVVTSVMAFFTILFTGRYPRGIFEFNVGVLRWTWRVAYYAYGALATDRYPPFSLREDPDYPAHLAVDYPEHLSRGLVLVKWWLLAIPHYLVIGLFLGGGAVAAGQADDARPASAGLITLLAVIAAVVLLFTGRYPQPVFDLVLGLNRWVLRVAGYVSLMTDEYPPFRLDQGGDETGPGRLAMSTPAPVSSPPAPTTPPAALPAATTPTPPGSRWTAGRIVALVLGCLFLVGSVGIGIGGASLALADGSMRDDDGFLMSGDEAFTTPTYAMTTGAIEIEGAGRFLPESILGDAKVTAEATGDSAVFVGVADSADVEAYLAGVGHDTLVGFDDDPVYRTSDGGAPATVPTESDIWVAQSSGTGSQSVTWEIEEGDWSIVVMNADGSRGVSSDVSVGATVPALDWVVGFLLTLAGLGLVVAIVLMVLALRTPRPR